MNVEFLHSFVTVADCGSIAEAARRLNLTGAGISGRIHALEAELGARLVQRAGRSIRLTDTGRKLLDRSRALLSDMRDIRAIALNKDLPGELRLGIFASGVNNVLPILLEGLYRLNPLTRVSVQVALPPQLCAAIAGGELDAALMVEPNFAIAKNCEWHSLREDPLVVIAPPHMAGQDAHEVLMREPFIRYLRANVSGQIADRYLRTHGLRPTERLELESFLAIIALVARGLGVSLVPDGPPLWASGSQVTRLTLPARAPIRRIGLVTASQGPRVELTREVLRIAHETIGEARSI